jgi:drug/metabolite transporter (DMT)-like permease
VRRAGAGVDPLYVTAIATIAGTPGLLVLGMPGMVRADWGAIDAVSWLAIGYSAVVSIVVAYWLYNSGVQMLGPSRAALYNCLTPLVAAAVAWMVLGERLTVQQLIGVSLVISGVLVSALAHVRRPSLSAGSPVSS